MHVLSRTSNQEIFERTSADFLFPFVPPSSQEFVFHTLHHQRRLAWSTEWIAQTTMHNIGNVLTNLFMLVNTYQNSLQNKQVFLIHQMFTYLRQTLHMSQEMMRTPKTEAQRFSLSDCVHSAINMMNEERKQKKIAIVQNIQPHVFVYGHHNIAQQIIINILRNSFEAFARYPTTKRTVRICVCTCEQQAKLTIVDTGPGIRETTAHQLTCPGFSTKKNGLGLGLTYVRWHMQRTFHGSLCLKNNIPHGLSTTLYFPQPPEIATIPACERHGPHRGSNSVNGNILPSSWVSV